MSATGGSGEGPPDVIVDSYDAIAYPGHAYPDAHPDRFATMAHLHGLPSFRPERCRVLELGCGHGAQLLSLAYALPDASFLGVDRSVPAIEQARETARALDLRNVEFEAMDVLDMPAASGVFDAIIAHGVFSWVPEPVRLKVLAICGASLAPDGVAFVSYLALPGNHGRDVYREILRFHTRSIADPVERVAQARSMLRLLADAPGGSPEQRALTASFVEELSRADDGVLHHDILAEHNAAYLFGDFVRLAGEAGLQFLSEAEYAAGRLPLDGAPGHVRAALQGLEGNILLHEQYHDFLRYRGFRQTLLCRAGAQIRRPASPERVRTLHVAARVATDDGTVDLRENVPVRFATRAGPIEAREPVHKAVLALLGTAWPAMLSFEALVERVREVSPRAPTPEMLADILLDGYGRGTLELWTTPPRYATSVTERPVSSVLARLQAARGQRMVSSLRNETIELTDDLAVAVLGLLDGTRDRAAAATALAEAVLAGGSTMELDGRPVTDAAEVRSLLDDRVGDALDELLANALLAG